MTIAMHFRCIIHVCRYTKYQ